MDKLYRGGYVLDHISRCFEKNDILVRDGRIIAIGKAIGTGEGGVEVINVSNRFVLPGLLDSHTHGRLGYDFSSADDEGISRMLSDYYRVGTRYVVPTIASAPLEEMYAAVGRLAAHIRKKGEAKIVGIHVEGRYLNPKRRGTHAEELLALPSVDELDGFISAAGELPIRFSIAPELEGGEAFIREAIARGAKISVAHSDATFEEAAVAVLLGADCFTHTFNAMSPIHHRAPGNTSAALVLDTYAEIIADGFHIAPAALEIANRCKPKEKLVLISDSMEASGMPDGDYSIAGAHVTVKDGKALSDDGAIAGSTASLLDCVKFFASYTSATLADAVIAASLNPSRMYGLDQAIGSVSVGSEAEFVIIDASELE